MLRGEGARWHTPALTLTLSTLLHIFPFYFPATRAILRPMRPTLTLALVLTLAWPVSARPPWKFLVHTGINLGTDLATSLTINRCMRDHGLGRCVGGDYGPFAAKESVRGGIALGVTFTSFKWKQADEADSVKHRLWWLLPDANAAFNAGVMLRNARRDFGPRESATSTITKLSLTALPH